MPSRRAILATIAGGATASIAGCGTRERRGRWLRAGYDRANTGFSPVTSGPAPPLSTLWRGSLPGDRAISYPSPVIVGDRVLTAVRTIVDDRAAVRLVGFDASDGSRILETTVTTFEEPRTTYRLVWDSLTVADSSVFLLAYDGLHAFTTDGERLWHTPLGTSPTNTILDAAQPVVVDGVVYAPTAGATDHTDSGEAVFALDPATGEQVWRYDVPVVDDGWTFPPAYWSGSLYVSLLDVGVVALDPATGEPRWEYRMPANGPPTVADGIVVCSAERDGSSWIVALDAATGERLWRVSAADARLGRRLAVRPDLELCYHRQGLDALVARDLRTGERRWTADGSPGVFGGGVSLTPERLYATVATAGRDRDDGVAVFDPATGKRQGFVPINEAGLDSSLAVGDSLVVTNEWAGPLTAVQHCSLSLGDSCLVS